MLALRRAEDLLELSKQGDSLLPYGLGRSYGDVCLNDGGVVLATRGLNRILSFDPLTGVLRCESGASFAEILKSYVPRGWFLPVTPGTKYVTVGGAIANDVHGKNHHRAGSLGCHVPQFELLRSTGERFLCSPHSHPEWYQATIGGLGLTGLITWAEIRLKPVSSRFLNLETIRFSNLDEFFALSRDSEADYEYTVAWVDGLARGRSLGRGLFMRANPAAPRASIESLSRSRDPTFSIPFDFPSWILNRWTIRAFNSVYYHKQTRRLRATVADFERFFYPLDSVENWNRIYGKPGFLQHQCVLPYDGDTSALREIFRRVTNAGMGSFLGVIKVFGSIASPGMLSFCRRGVTLALDFPNHGAQLFRLLDSMDEIVADAGGAVNPSKDARMSGRNFRKFFPASVEFASFIDPKMSSGFWRRVSQGES